jgi:Arc/MetJ family transcription regulator
LSSGEPAVALLWAAVLAAYSVKTKVEKVGSAFRVVASDDDAIKLAGLYFRYGSPLLEGDERIINHKLSEAVKLGAEGLNIRWEGLRRTEDGIVAADLIISEGDVEIKYNVYLWEKISLEFLSTDRSRAELAARLLRLAGVGAEVKKKEDGKRDVWRVEVSTDVLAAGREELREAIAEIVRKAVENG